MRPSTDFAALTGLTSRRAIAFLLLTLGLSPQPAAAQATATRPAAPAETRPAARSLPKVHLVATGGTISNRNGGRLTAEELVTSMPGLDRYVRPEAEQFANTSSNRLTLRQWVDLAKRINTLLAGD